MSCRPGTIEASYLNQVDANDTVQKGPNSRSTEGRTMRNLIVAAIFSSFLTQYHTPGVND